MTDVNQISDPDLRKDVQEIRERLAGLEAGFYLFQFSLTNTSCNFDRMYRIVWGLIIIAIVGWFGVIVRWLFFDRPPGTG